MVKVKKKENTAMEKFYRRTGINLKDRLLKYRLHFYMRDKNYCLDEKPEREEHHCKYPKIAK